MHLYRLQAAASPNNVAYRLPLMWQDACMHAKGSRRLALRQVCTCSPACFGQLIEALLSRRSTTVDSAYIVSPYSSSSASEACSEVLMQVEPSSRVLCLKTTNSYTCLFIVYCTLTRETDSNTNLTQILALSMTIQRGEHMKVLCAPTHETDTCRLCRLYYIHCGAPRFSNTRITPLYPAARITCTPHWTTDFNTHPFSNQKRQAQVRQTCNRSQRHASQMHAHQPRFI